MKQFEINFDSWSGQYEAEMHSVAYTSSMIVPLHCNNTISILFYFIDTECLALHQKYYLTVLHTFPYVLTDSVLSNTG